MPDRGTNPGENFEWFTFTLGGRKMELVSTVHPDGDSGVGRYLDKYGEGYHHISISVDDLAEAIRYFESKNIRVLAPNFEKDDWKHCYLHPKDTFGAMIQVFEENEKTLADSGD